MCCNFVSAFADVPQVRIEYARPSIPEFRVHGMPFKSRPVRDVQMLTRAHNPIQTERGCSLQSRYEMKVAIRVMGGPVRNSS